MEAETAGERNRRLYGRPRVPRSDRRVMLALLAADGLSGWLLSRLAQVSGGWVYIVLGRLADRGWVSRFPHETYPDSGRFAYTLTPEGRKCVRLLLGLPAPVQLGREADGGT